MKMATIVKIITDNYGEKIINPKWHLSVNDAATDRTLCQGVAYGPGDSYAKYEVKSNSKGAIDCQDCVKRIKWFKNIKL